MIRTLLLLLIAMLVVGCGRANSPSQKTSHPPTDGKLVFVKDGKAYFEQPDGTTLSVALSELSDLERQGVSAMMDEELSADDTPLTLQITSLSDLDKQPPQPEPVFIEVESSRARVENVPSVPAKTEGSPEPVTHSEDTTELIGAVQHLFQAKCHRCHGLEGANEGGFNFAMNLRKLKENYIAPEDPDNSYLFERLSSSDSETIMPPAGESSRLDPAEINLVRTWIERGAPTPSAKLRKFIRNEEVAQLVLDDLNELPERNRRFYRYFLLTNLYNSGISEDELQTYRLALSKLINSLSWNPTLYSPESIDANRTILRLDLRRLNWTSQIWDEIADSNPYGLFLRSPEAERCYELTQTKMPFARVDWFVYAGSKPPLYYSILGIPQTDTELENLLRVNVEANIEQEKVVRAGFNRSGVSQNNRLIERHVTPYGGYWKSYDFAGNTGNQNLFEHPLGPAGRDAFEHAGGEMIFTLPNGMQGYLLTDERGRRIDKGPTEIVSDPQRPDRAVMNGISCMSCHYAGMISKADEIRDVVLANRTAFEETERILSMYPGNDRLSEFYQSDGKQFIEALQQLGLTRITKTSEPIATTAVKFEAALDARSAAAEFGLTQNELLDRLAETDTVARSLGALRVAGGSVKRDSFVEMFQRAVDELEILGTESPKRSNRSTRSTSKSSRMATIKVSDRSAVGEIRQFPRASWNINTLAFSPDGGWLAIGTLDQKVVVVDVDSKRELALTDRLDILGQVTCLAFSPDGDYLIAGGYKGVIAAWKLTSKGALQPKGIFSGHTAEVKCLAFSSDSRFVLSGGRDNTLRYWELETYRETASTGGFARDILACQFSSNRRQGIGSDGNSLVMMDLQSGEIDKSVPLAFKGISQTASISPDGERLVCADGYRLRIFDTENGNELPALQDREMQWACAFSPDSRLVLSGGSGKVNIWDLENQRRLASYPTAGTGYCKAVSFSPDNLHVAGIGTSQRVISIFRLPPENDR